MKAIVTGSNGFIGYNLCLALKRRHSEAVGVDDLSSGSPDNVVDGFQYVRAKVQDRLRMMELLREFRPDVVFHLAAIPRVSYSVENPYETAEANVMGTVSILDGIVAAELADSTRFVFSSSSSVYGGAEELPTPESHPCSPKSPYALEKWQSEQWCQVFAKLYDADTVCLRYFNVFGPHALFGGPYSTVLAAWLYHLYVDADYQPFLEGDGTQTRDFCFVDNVVQANISAATRKQRWHGEEINVAQGRSYSLLECRQMLERLAGRELPLARKPPRVGDVKHTLADISLAKEMLGYEPEIDFERQLSVMAEWYRTSYPAKQ